MANEIDELMDMDPMDMSEGHLDAIIAYHRNNRAQLASGGKPKKETGPKKELASVLKNILGPAKATPLPPEQQITRRKL